MSSDSRQAQYGLVILAALAVLLIKALWLAFTSTKGLVMTPWIIDDTYINIRVARNLARGMGYSFNGIDPTNGTPFLWTYLTMFNHLLFPLFTAVKATFLLSAFFGALSTIVSYVIAWKITGKRAAAWVAFLLTGFTGNAFLVSLNGMDTAFFTFFVLLSIAVYVGWGTTRIRNPFIAGCLLGVPVGLAILTRGDGLFLAATIGLSLLMWLWTDRGHRRTALLYLVGFCLIAGACLGGLMLWGMLHVGSALPANQVGRQAIAWGWHGAPDISFLKYLKVVGWNIFQLEHLLTISTGASVLALVALLASLQRKETRTLSALTGAYCFIFFTMLVAYQWYFPDFHGLRYINPATHLLLILVAVFLTDLFRGKNRTTAIALVTCAVIALSWYSFYTLLNRSGWMKGRTYTGHISQAAIHRYWAFFDWAKKNVPANTVVGVRDHGRFALFTDLAVQDLSGVIDPVVAEKTAEGGEALRNYLRGKDVEYLFVPSLDERTDRLYQLLHGFLRLEEVEQAPPSPTDQTLYRIRW